jgi:hypothetical protein
MKLWKVGFVIGQYGWKATAATFNKIFLTVQALMLGHNLHTLTYMAFTQVFLFLSLFCFLNRT